MFCEKCGAKIEDWVVFCPECGAPVEPLEPEPPIEPTPAPVAAAAPPPKKPTVDNESISTIATMLLGGIGLLWLLPALINIASFIFGKLAYIVPWGLRDPFYLLLNFLFVVKSFVGWIIILAAVAAVAAGVYLLIGRKKEDTPLVILGICTAAVVLLSAALSKSWRIPRAVIFILALLAIAAGIILAIHVFIKKDELKGALNLQSDLDTIKSMGQSIRSTSTTSETPEDVTPDMYTDPNIPKYELTEEIESLDSHFDGKGVELFVKLILMNLLTAVTCGIAAPWAIVNVRKWVISHTVIEGRRLTFTGNGTQLFGLWIKWVLLSIITCGFYSIFAYVDYLKWEKKHTGYEDQIPDEKGLFANSYFEGVTPEYLGYSVFMGWLTVITCGIGFPWGVNMYNRWDRKNTYVSGDKLFYDGTGQGLLGTYLLNILLTVITCGIYSAWAICSLNRYYINHTHVDARKTR